MILTLFFAPKGLLCRGVWKIMLVCPCVRIHPMSRNRSADLFLASFWNVSRAMLNPRVQKLDHFVLGRPGERKSAGFELWRTDVAPGPSSTGLLYTIVPSGPPLPCGCYLVKETKFIGYIKTILGRFLYGRAILY